ncbi:MAG TPA: aldose epimerase family protein [Rhizomicrobium sp.]|nr:aldose epimerase family protein [Rhizomicrobium sp.]
MAAQPYGTKADGTPVHAFTLQSGRLSATVLDMGGTITAIRVPDTSGQTRNVVLGLKDLAAYEASGWWNCLIGRYANRLKNGVTLEGRHYPLSPDANGVTLHGGRGQSWGRRSWQVTASDEAMIALRLVSPDGDQGFPGTMTIEVTYRVTDDGLRLDYATATDAVTVVNLTNHLYFNLAGSGSVLPQRLQLNADAITPTDAQQIPTGRIAPVAGTGFDFRTPAAIGGKVDSNEPQMALARGLDHNFVLNKSAPDTLDWAARLSDPESGITLELLTTEPGLQVYSTNNVKPGQFNALGGEIQKRDGLALETQHFPDSPNQPAFPPTLLKPGETFRSTTIFRFPVA